MDGAAMVSWGYRDAACPEFPTTSRAAAWDWGRAVRGCQVGCGGVGGQVANGLVQVNGSGPQRKERFQNSEMNFYSMQNSIEI
jgi:hypothetical protein